MADNGHPSNRLYRGEVTGFDEAMRLVVAECEWEMRHSLRAMHAEMDADPERFTDLSAEERAQMERDDDRMNADLIAYIAAAKNAAAIYAKCMKEAEAQARTLLVALDDGHADLIAKALETGDYSQLAI